MAVTVRLPGVLREYVGGRGILTVEVAGDATLRDVLDLLAVQVPALERRIRDERGVVRRHVNLFIDAGDARDSGLLAAPVRPGSEVMVIPAVSGG